MTGCRTMRSLVVLSEPLRSFPVAGLRSRAHERSAFAGIINADRAAGKCSARRRFGLNTAMT